MLKVKVQYFSKQFDQTLVERYDANIRLLNMSNALVDTLSLSEAERLHQLLGEKVREAQHEISYGPKGAYQIFEKDL